VVIVNYKVLRLPPKLLIKHSTDMLSGYGRYPHRVFTIERRNGKYKLRGDCNIEEEPETIKLFNLLLDHR